MLMLLRIKWSSVNNYIKKIGLNQDCPRQIWMFDHSLCAKALTLS